MEDEGRDLLDLLRRAADGDLAALEEAWKRVYGEVVAIASAQRRRWSGDFTLDSRALASEVYLKIYGGSTFEVRNVGHFFAVLARAVRQILVNYAEGRRAQKRGGGAVHVSLADVPELNLPDEVSDQLLDLDDALARFKELDPRAAEVVEMRFFAGLTYDEIGEALGIGRATAKRDWDAAKLWLYRELGPTATLLSAEPPDFGAQ